MPVAVPLARPGQAHRSSADHRRPRRRLPPDRRRDGHPRPGRHRADRAAGDGLEVVDATTGQGLDVGDGDDNLVRRALGLAGRRAPACGSRSGSRPGAGLGGGSADAAAVLRWAGVDRPRRRPPGSGPTCRSAWSAAGPGSAASARSSSRCPSSPATLTLLTPPFGCSTPAVYRAWDDLGGPDRRRPGNDLEPAALAVEPRLAEWRDRAGRGRRGRRLVWPGSGSTWFVEGAVPGEGRVVVHTTPAALRARRRSGPGRAPTRRSAGWESGRSGGEEASSSPRRATCRRRGAGSACASASSCASSCACACGAS